MSVRSRGPSLFALGFVSLVPGHRQHSRGRHDGPARRPAAAPPARRLLRRATRTNPLETPLRHRRGPEDMSIVYVPGLTGNPFYNTVACGAENRAEELGIDFTYQGAPTFDVALQSGIVSALIGEDRRHPHLPHRPGRDDPAAARGQGRRDQPHRHRRRSLRPGDPGHQHPVRQPRRRSVAALAVEAVGEDVGGDVLGLSNNAGSRSASSASRGSPTSWRSTRRSTTSARSTPTTSRPRRRRSCRRRRRRTTTSSACTRWPRTTPRARSPACARRA